MSDIKTVCTVYFQGFQELSSRENPCTIKVVALCKVLSYFTVVVPLAFAFVLGIETLRNRCSQTTPPQIEPPSLEGTFFVPVEIQIESWGTNLGFLLLGDDFDVAFPTQVAALRLLHLAVRTYCNQHDLDETFIFSEGTYTVRQVFIWLKNQSDLFTYFQNVQGSHEDLAKRTLTQLQLLQGYIERLSPTS